MLSVVHVNKYGESSQQEAGDDACPDPLEEEFPAVGKMSLLPVGKERGSHSVYCRFGVVERIKSADAVFEHVLGDMYGIIE